MTSPHRKQLERSLLDFYLHVAGLDGKVVAQESPDFVVISRTSRIGVEITEYHQPKYPGHQFSRTQIEAEWDRIRAAVVEYRDSHAGLENLSVQLSFTNLNIPNAKEHRRFIQAIHNEIHRAKPDLNERFTTIRINDQHSAVLRRYLKSIDVRVANCYMEWDWNHTFAWVGSSDDELVKILSAKLCLAPAEDIDELHLVVAADGTTGGTISDIQVLNCWIAGRSSKQRWIAAITTSSQFSTTATHAYGNELRAGHLSNMTVRVWLYAGSGGADLRAVASQHLAVDHHQGASLPSIPASALRAVDIDPCGSPPAC